MVEGRHQLEGPGAEHPVAEHVARHVADADRRDRRGVGVDPEVAEVALHRLPGALGRDAHLLVVVARRAARGEGVAQPEAVLGGDRVGQVGEGGRALVGRHHQVGVVTVVGEHRRGVDDLPADDVVGQVEQTGDEVAVAGRHLGRHGVAVTTGRRPLHDEAALGADRHDDGVLHHLGLHQAEHLGAEVLPPVRPPQPAPAHPPAPEVHALHPGGADEDLVAGPGQRQVGHLGRVELERHRVAGLAGPEPVGPLRGLHQGQERAEDAVLVEAGDGVDGRLEPLREDAGLVVGVGLAGRVEAGVEQLHQQAGDVGVGGQRPLHVGLREGRADLAEVLAVGPEDRHLPAGEAGAEHQPVEPVVLRLAPPGGGEGVGEDALHALGLEVPLRRSQAEVVDPHDALVAGGPHLVGPLVDDAHAHVLQQG